MRQIQGLRPLAVLTACCGALLGLASAALGAGEAHVTGARAAGKSAAKNPIPAKAYSKGPAATAVHFEQDATKARLVFDMNETVEARAYVLANPDRAVIELSETAFLLDPQAGKAKGGKAGLVGDFRFGNFAPGRSRVVVDLKGPARIVKGASERTDAGGAARLVLELAATDAESFRAAARAARAEELRAAALSQPTPAAKPRPAPAGDARPVVALDPGHGGVDNGATNKDAIEKNIVYEFASAVAAKLEAGGRVRPLLTRQGDVFIALGERVKIAQSAGADLFVSVHADTLRETFVKGATVYTLSDKASDAESARVAAAENAADKAGGVADSDEGGEVGDILSDFTRRETRVLSHAYARSLAQYWKNVGDLNKNPLRSAGFRVLKAPDMPSVLLEIGYISSGDDVARLISSEWRDRAAVHVARSIEKYFADKAAFDKSASGNGESTGALARGADASSADKKSPITEKVAAGGAPARP